MCFMLSSKKVAFLLPLFLLFVQPALVECFCFVLFLFGNGWLWNYWQFSRMLWGKMMKYANLEGFRTMKAIIKISFSLEIGGEKTTTTTSNFSYSSCHWNLCRWRCERRVSFFSLYCFQIYCVVNTKKDFETYLRTIHTLATITISFLYTVKDALL